MLQLAYEVICHQTKTDPSSPPRAEDSNRENLSSEAVVSPESICVCTRVFK